jgi:hypothetical protein
LPISLSKRIALAFAALAAFGILAPPEARAQSEQIRRFVRLYDAARPGADSLQQITLELDPSGRAVMTMRFPGYTKTAAGVPVTSVFERGTWSVANQYAIVHFVRRANGIEGKHDAYKPEDVALTFSLGFRCTLKLERDDANVFGKDGLRLKGRGC